MENTGVELLALGPGPHMQWLLGYHPHPDERPCLLCLSQTGAAMLMPSLNADAAREHTELPFFKWADADGPGCAFKDLLKDLSAATATSLALDETMRADFAALVQDTLPNATRQFTASTIGALRMCKDNDEYLALKANALSADSAMQAGWAAMNPGMTELEVAEVIRASFTDQGAKPMFTIIGTGGNGAFPHHHTGHSKLNAGDAVVMDIGGSMQDYSSDITRMAILGTPPNDYEKIHQIVELAVTAAMQAAKPGVVAKEVDAAARNAITEAGYGEYFMHRLGHGLGIEIHEQPYLTSVSETVLQEGMVFSIEPGIYLPDRFGLRLEEIVILRPDGPEILSELPRTMTIIS